MKALLGLYLVFVIAPVALIVAGAFGETWLGTVLPTGITGVWITALVTDPDYVRAFITSLSVASASIALGSALAAPLAYVVLVRPSRLADGLVRLLSLAPLSTPPLVLALALMTAWPSGIGALWLLLAGHVVLVLPYLLAPLIAEGRAQDVASLERASASLGAGPLQRMGLVVLPLLSRGLVAGAVAAGSISIGEFQLSNLLAAFADRTYPVLLYQAFQAATGFACAATLLLVLLALASALVGAGLQQASGPAAGRGAAS